MTTPSTDEVLRWVNLCRIQYHIGDPLKEMPKGTPADCDWCPVAQAVCGEVDGRIALVHDLNDYLAEVELPNYVQEWIEAFDSEMYPELIASST